MKSLIIATLLGLAVTGQSFAAESLICADRSKETYVVDITEAAKLNPGESLSVELGLRPFRSHPDKIDILTCVRPTRDALTAEEPAFLACTSANFEMYVEKSDNELIADLYTAGTGKVVQASIPCLVTDRP